jgi:hypothetical protein
MLFLRMLNHPRRSQQRLGFLKYLVWQASSATTNSLHTIGNRLVNAVSRKVSVALVPDLQDYIKYVLTDSKYDNLRSTTLKQERQNKPRIEIEIQDLYLCDPNLPSRRGKLVSDDWNRYPQLAVDLHLLRRGTYSTMTRGRSFLSLVPDEESKAFDVDMVNRPRITNPFSLSVAQKLLLLFSLVDADGDVLRPLYEILLGFADPLTAADAGNHLPDVYRMLAKEARNRVRSGDDSLRIQMILDNAEKIEAVKRNPNPGGKNPREHGITVRLEPFVDIGLLDKVDPFTYSYRVTNATKRFFEPLLESESVDDFLNSRFFATANKSLNLNGEHTVASVTSLPMLQKAYNVLKSPVGYSPILELCLLAGIYSLLEAGNYLEISESIQILKSLQKDKPRLVTFNVDRWGMLNFVKFNDDLAKNGP